MAEDRIGKLFLLAMSSNSDAEALSALEMIKTVLKKEGLDAHAIADALNRASSRPEDDDCDLGSSLRSANNTSNASRDEADWKPLDPRWQDAIYAPFQSTYSTPMNDKGVEQEKDAHLANPWLTGLSWEEDAESAVETDRNYLMRRLLESRKQNAKCKRRHRPIMLPS
jgi:hypothetical protein